MNLPRLMICVALVGLSCVHTPLRAQTIDFNKVIRPILSNRCLACHGPDSGHREAGLRLDERTAATTVLESGHAAIQPGDPDASEMIRRVLSQDADIRMPPPEFGKPLTEAEIQLLQQWIREGAQFATHWSYVPPVRPELPAVSKDDAAWVRSPVDAFAVQQMRAHQLQPAPHADAHTLVRRVFLDLTGLPPTLEEGTDWAARLQAAGEQGTPAHEQVWAELAEHLLHRPEFGEHWARKWLDVARYADSAGYADDPARTIWPWRDWVIRAINQGMPFDQFTVEQLAGDLLPNPTEDQIIATAFHRNTMTNNEGGTQDEEFRNVAVVDRVNTTMAVWMGTTMACAQCHNHKYDPLSQEEYFQLFAILNNTEDADRGDDSPRLPLFTSEQKQRREFLAKRLVELNGLMATPTPVITASQAAWEVRLKTQPDWKTVTPQEIRRAGGGEAEIQADGTLFVPTATDRDVYTIDIPMQQLTAPGNATLASVAALQLATIPSEKLPGQGAGHGGGNFVITELKAQWIPQDNTAPTARFIRVQIPGNDRILSLAEVQVLSGGINVAPTGKATQSSTDFAGPAEYAIDGNTDGDFLKKSVTHTAISTDPWWELDLGQETPIDRIVLWNRTGNGIHTRLANFRISLLNANRDDVQVMTVVDPPNPSGEYAASGITDVTFSAAAADFQQDGFPAAEVIDGRTETENGWAVGGRGTEPHALTLVPQNLPDAAKGGTLRLIIEQNSPYANHLLGQFRIRVTDQAGAMERAGTPTAVLAAIDLPADQRSPEQQQLLADHYRLQLAPELAEVRRELQELNKELQDMKPEASVLVMKELPTPQRRKTLFQFRGNYLDRGHEVHEGLPAVFSPPQSAEPWDRLSFARWLVSDSNPLTARVVVNRYWEDLFGRGLVATSEEFGSQGELPTHPELLDWLARDLIESGWNTRALLKSLVTSAVYRQSAKVTAENAALDPDNRWLARGPRVRLSSEMVRDQALAVAGLLSQKMYGPPVKPPQPSLGLSAAFGSSTDWQTSSGEDRYRRAIYTTWRRSNPYPSMATFDAPNREVCTLKRNRTNTPLQALVTLNDPVYVEASQGFARRVLAQSGTAADQLRFGFQQALLRDPSDAELTALLALLEETRATYAQDSAAAIALATDPLGPLPNGIKPEDAAAMTVVSGVILNLDEMLMKR